ncbi:branched-chain amino acid ABC transporter permease [Paraburkholderia caribensis]|uniref:branched-chain amino acid ABC transporter permease n=1 Tax=Paraburkholderia caribensis TaxID=75105 RepID=UPI00078B5991|nr:branched-chain amino acid ABC transporter permease [Paraburkholderia caribensis]AMV48326.1 ABC transporter permease [Paraburkholderia caribensis]
MKEKTLIREIVAGAVVIALLIAFPLIYPSAALRDFVIYVIAYGLLAMSLNLLVGLTGQAAFGHAMFFASGAYVFGLLMQTDAVSIPVAIVLTVAATAVFAFLIGCICVRLTGIYFSFITLAFQMFVHSVILTWVDLTGGDQGLQGGIPRSPFLGIDLGNSLSLYLFCAGLFIACLFIMRLVWLSPFGYVLRMIRDNPARANFLGVNVFRVKLGVFVLSGGMASVGGIILALFVSGAYPEFAFWTTSGDAIFMLMLGGTHLFVGPIIGALMLEVIKQYLKNLPEYNGLILGVVILVIVLGLRRGVADALYDRLIALRRKKKTVIASNEAVLVTRDDRG